jgi:F-type H+-transporting ATPase subunit a
MHTISIAAENLFTLFGFLPVTNTLLTAWVVMAVLIVFAFIASRKIQEVPSGLQNVMEVFIGGMLSLFEGIVGSAKQSKEFFSVAATIFIFVLCSNWFGLIPGVGSIGFFEGEANHPAFVPLFRAASSDLSFTLAIALIAIFYVQVVGFRHLKLKYLGKFFNFKNPIFFFVGILELISEFAKMVSFSFRLFGNVFAGEVLLVVMTFLIPYFIPVPFYALEVFVGLVQAGVFAALTLVFLKGATAHH